MFFGVPEVIRTPDLPLRRRSLYPAELRKHAELYYSIKKRKEQELFLLLCVFCVLFGIQLIDVTFNSHQHQAFQNRLLLRYIMQAFVFLQEKCDGVLRNGVGDYKGIHVGKGGKETRKI